MPRVVETSLLDEKYELIDPTPDIQALFLEFNTTFFYGLLSACEVKWSPRMTLCAGVCSYQPASGFCSIRLSVPLLSIRPRSDLINTLLHEMIHALLFVTKNNRDRDGHGPDFLEHADRINRTAGTKITVYHTFHDEVDSYRTHWWQCNGVCTKRGPYYGLVKRSMNRPPQPADDWWARHQATCGGVFTKIREPEGYGKKKSTKANKAKASLKRGRGGGSVSGGDDRTMITMAIAIKGELEHANNGSKLGRGAGQLSIKDAFKFSSSSSTDASSSSSSSSSSSPPSSLSSSSSSSSSSTSSTTTSISSPHISAPTTHHQQPHKEVTRRPATRPQHEPPPPPPRAQHSSTPMACFLADDVIELLSSSSGEEEEEEEAKYKNDGGGGGGGGIELIGGGGGGEGMMGYLGEGALRAGVDADAPPLVFSSSKEEGRGGLRGATTTVAIVDTTTTTTTRGGDDDGRANAPAGCPVAAGEESGVSSSVVTAGGGSVVVRNSNGTETGEAVVECPVCGAAISSLHINGHLDGCLSSSYLSQYNRSNVR